MIKIMIVDDMIEYIDYYSTLISKHADMKVVEIASSAAEAIKKASLCCPDIILMDIQMENDTAGLTATREIKKILPQTKILILTVHQQKELIVKAYEAGISEYLLKTVTPEEIIDCIRSLYNNQSLSDSIHDAVKNEMLRLSLERRNFIEALKLLNRFSQTELFVIRDLMMDKKYNQIALSLNLQETTVRTLLRRIGIKIGDQSLYEFISTLKKLNIMELINSLLE